MKKASNLYSPLHDRSIWSGRPDALPNEYIYQNMQFLDLNEPAIHLAENKNFAILGFKSDAGVQRNLGRPGAKEGPRAFREALAKLPLHKKVNLYDAGNVECSGNDLEAAQCELMSRVADILTLNLSPIVIGGGHETAWGHFQGIAQYHRDDIAILNFDAHFDLRPLMEHNLGSSGTPFRQINDFLTLQRKPFHYYCAGIQPFANTRSLFQYAKANHVQYLLAEEINFNPYDLSFIEDIIQSHQHIYVSVCLDVFNAAIAPGVSAPQAMGIMATYVMNALRLLRDSQKVLSLDIVELAPIYDVNMQTAKLAAILLMEYLGVAQK
jgi:formiminoglutamase